MSLRLARDRFSTRCSCGWTASCQALQSLIWPNVYGQSVQPSGSGLQESHQRMIGTSCICLSICLSIHPSIIPLYRIIYTHARIDACIYIYTKPCANEHIYICICICIYTTIYNYVCVRICTYAYVDVYKCTCICTCICICICIWYVCVYVYVYVYVNAYVYDMYMYMYCICMCWTNAGRKSALPNISHRKSGHTSSMIRYKPRRRLE